MNFAILIISSILGLGSSSLLAAPLLGSLNLSSSIFLSWDNITVAPDAAAQASMVAPIMSFLLGPHLTVALPLSLTTPAISSEVPMVTANTTTSDTMTDITTSPASTISMSDAPSTITGTPISSATPVTSTVCWAAPAQMTDLSAFNISAFPGGQQNLKIVNGIPAEASSTKTAAESTASSGSALLIAWDNSSSVLQLFYPANSINPGTKPQGGAEFYASPLYMVNATNTTLEYSVFFPQDFDWVLAGKLPGLYGGHTGCSGGNEALDCFSTRLMWRQGGAGELYLYAPKRKQTDSLCSDPQSVCDAEYGLSVGRGSFFWAAGTWTTVRQTVVLNTPGEQNGAFMLDVNGKRVIDRQDVFYRDASPGSEPSPTLRQSKTHIIPSASPSLSSGNDLLGSLFGNLLLRREPESIRSRELGVGSSPASSSSTALIRRLPNINAAAADVFEVDTVHAYTDPVVPTSSNVFDLDIAANPLSHPTYLATTQTILPVYSTSMPLMLSSYSYPTKPPGFIGLFFSTFFGGHDPQYATPRDQYTWFKDFGITINS